MRTIAGKLSQLLRTVSLLIVVLWLWLGVGMIKEEGYNLLENFLSDVHGTLNAICRFRPIRFANRDPALLTRPAVAERDFQQIAAQHHRDPMEGITMPRCRLTRLQSLSSD
jgi:hypothetical protein